MFLGCEKSELVQLDLKGTLKGTVYTLDEFGYINNDNENIVIQLEGSEPLISIITDSSGIYEIKDIPSGTYNLIVSKEGYGKYQKQGFQIVGGNEPLYFNRSIIEKSSTTITNLSLEIVNSSEISLKGIVNHNYIINGWIYTAPNIRYFIHNLSNPSNINYLQTSTILFYEDSGSQFETWIQIDDNQFPSGSKIYIIAYGCYGHEMGNYDILSNQVIFTSVGTGSNITSITIP